MPLEVAAQSGLFTSLLRQIVLFAIRNEAMHAVMIGMVIGGPFLMAPRM